MSKQCVNCHRVDGCTETSPDKLIQGYVCDRWLEETFAIATARADIIKMFGLQGAKAVIKRDLKEED